MNDNVLNSEATEQFKILIQHSENIKKELDCYSQLIKELMIKTYCPN